MIREVMLPELQSRFPNRGMRAGESINQIGIFPAAHGEVGDLQIWDDGDEATIYIGSITHGHFDSDDRTLAEANSARCISDEVVEFLELLFADRVLIHKSRTDGSDGWEVFDSDDFSDARLNVTDRTYVWSGPIKNPKTNDAG